jgi:hypothetical protein
MMTMDNLQPLLEVILLPKLLKNIQCPCAEFPERASYVSFTPSQNNRMNMFGRRGSIFHSGVPFNEQPARGRVTSSWPLLW